MAGGGPPLIVPFQPLGFSGAGEALTAGIFTLPSTEGPKASVHPGFSLRDSHAL